jgi:hypothetical protein
VLTAVLNVARLKEGWFDMALIPALLSGKMGKENRGFGLGLIPGLLYKDQYKDKEEERRAQEQAAAEQAAAQGMKKGGKVKSASARADGIAIRGKTRA